MRWAVAIGSLLMLFLIPVTLMAEEDLAHYLLKKKAEIEKKEAELNQREQDLKDLQHLIEKRIKKYTQILEEMNEILKRIEKEKKTRIEKIVQTYEKMDPAEAAIRISEMDTEMGIKILAGMKPRKAAKVLSEMEPEKAADYTTRITRIRGLRSLASEMGR